MQEVGQAPFSVLYEVYATNADLEQVKLSFQSFDKDMAETKAYLLFRQSGYGISYMLLNRNTLDYECLLLSARDKFLRGECQA